MRANSSAVECCGTLPYQCHSNRNIIAAVTGSSDCRNQFYCGYVDSNGFNADDVATLRPGTQHTDLL